LEFADSIPEQEMGKYVGVHETGLDLYIEAAGLIDVEKELARANAELESIAKDLAHSEGKLANEQFVGKAPAEIIDKERRKVAELTERKQTLLDRKQALGG
jgi:valyl-tRNA synthetase